MTLLLGNDPSSSMAMKLKLPSSENAWKMHVCFLSSDLWIDTTILHDGNAFDFHKDQYSLQQMAAYRLCTRKFPVSLGQPQSRGLLTASWRVQTLVQLCHWELDAWVVFCGCRTFWSQGCRGAGCELTAWFTSLVFKERALFDSEYSE